MTSREHTKMHKMYTFRKLSIDSKNNSLPVNIFRNALPVYDNYYKKNYEVISNCRFFTGSAGLSFQNHKGKLICYVISNLCTVYVYNYVLNSSSCQSILITTDI